MIRNLLAFLSLAMLLAASSAIAKDPDSAAYAFGSSPALWGVRMSPDGSKISFLQTHPKDFPIAVVSDLRTGKKKLVLASVEDKFDIQWCDWATNARLLCGYAGIHRDAFALIPKTRLVAVDADGGGMKVLLERRLRNERTQFQDQIVDWLVDDPEHVLIQMPSSNGTGVSRLDINSGRVR